jgi:hypothetical protein
MNETLHPIAQAAAPLRAARQKYLDQLAATKAEIDQRTAELHVPALCGVPNQLDIERARLRDEMTGSSDAPGLEQQCTDAHDAHDAAVSAAKAAEQALPALKARAELLEGLAAEARTLELGAVSDTAAKLHPAAALKYRAAAQQLIAALVELQAVTAAMGAVGRHRINGSNGLGGLSPFDIPRGTVELPALEVLGSDLTDYVSGSASAGVVTQGFLHAGASQALAGMLGGEQ